MVSMHTNKYFGRNVELRRQVISGLNRSFDHTDRANRMIMDSRVLNVLDSKFGSRRFNIDSEADRRSLGYGIVDRIRRERKQ